MTPASEQCFPGHRLGPQVSEACPCPDLPRRASYPAYAHQPAGQRAASLLLRRRSLVGSRRDSHVQSSGGNSVHSTSRTSSMCPYVWLVVFVAAPTCRRLAGPRAAKVAATGGGPDDLNGGAQPTIRPDRGAFVIVGVTEISYGSGDLERVSRAAVTRIGTPGGDRAAVVVPGTPRGRDTDRGRSHAL